MTHYFWQLSWRGLDQLPFTSPEIQLIRLRNITLRKVEWNQDTFRSPTWSNLRFTEKSAFATNAKTIHHDFFLEYLF